jgi:hypothetical protein
MGGLWVRSVALGIQHHPDLRKGLYIILRRIYVSTRTVHEIDRDSSSSIWGSVPSSRF